MYIPNVFCLLHTHLLLQVVCYLIVFENYILPFIFRLVKLDIESNDIKDIMKALNNYEMPLIEELSANFSKIHVRT